MLYERAVYLTILTENRTIPCSGNSNFVGYIQCCDLVLSKNCDSHLIQRFDINSIGSSINGTRGLLSSWDESRSDTGLAFFLDPSALSNRPSGFVTQIAAIHNHHKLEFDFVMCFPAAWWGDSW